MVSPQRPALKTLLATCLIALPLVSGTTEPSPSSDPPRPYVRDQILVKLKSPLAPARLARLHAQHGTRLVRTIPRLGVQTLQLPEALGVREALARYRADPRVLFAEPNFILRAAWTPDDPSLGHQWGLHNLGQTGGTPDADLDAPEGWELETGDPGVVIAVLDTGVALRHPDLIGQLWRNPGEIADNLLDDDGNGYVDDVHGWAFMGDSNFVDDGNGHGTYCAALAAAATDNATGGAGVAPDARIMPVKVLSDGGTGSHDLSAAGIVYAVDNGARILNMSFGGTSASQTLEAAMQYAWDAGAVMVCAAGNDGTHQVHYPGAYDPYCVTVAATDHDDVRAGFSNVGPEVDLAAPGVAVFSATRYLNEWQETHRFIYGTANGTSASTALVSGLAGLLLSQDPSLANQELVDRLKYTADAVHPDPSAGEDERLGTGRINAYRALTETPHPVISLQAQTVDDAGGNGDGRPDPGETVQLVVTLGGHWADAIEVTAILSATDPCITVTKASAVFGDLPAGTTTDNAADPFTLAVDPACARGTRVDLNLDLAAEGHASTRSFELVAGRPAILLVDDDGADGYQPPETAYELLQSRELAYTDALDAAGLSYDTWEVPFDQSGPTAADMAPYELVIWNPVAVYDPGQIGYIVGIALSAQDFASLSSYLDGGGNLLLTTSNITGYYGSDPADPGRNLLYEFLDGYLGIQQPPDTSMLIQNYGEGLAGSPGDLFDGLSASLDNALMYTFDIQPDAAALFTLADPLLSHHGEPSAVRYPANAEAAGHRAVFLGFDFDKLRPQVVAHHLMATLVAWLRGQPIDPVDNLPPVADPGDDRIVWAEEGSDSVSVTLDGTASQDPDGGPLAYEWSAGGSIVGYTPTLSHEFAIGPHFVRLRVEDASGARDAATQVVYVQPPLAANAGPPIPAAPSGPSPVPPDSLHSYTAVTTDPEEDLVYYLFSWGDGRYTVTEHYPSGEPVSIPHAFPYEGVFEVRVWAFDAHGDAYSALPCWSEPLSVVVGAMAEADIAVSLADDPDPVPRGEEVTYSAVIANLGPTSAPAVSFSQTLPKGVTLRGVSYSQGTCTSSRTSVDCELGTLAAGSPATVEIRVRTRRPGILRVTATAGTPSLPDPDPDNNSVEETTNVTR